jgi:Uncharacterized conserved small protein
MAYELIEAGSASELTDLVNAKLEEGWQLYGLPIVLNNANYLFQAVVKDETPFLRVPEST